MQPCKDMCKVIDFSLAPPCFPSVRSWSWQDSPACRGFASTWALARQDRNPKCCFMAYLEQPSLVLAFFSSASQHRTALGNCWLFFPRVGSPRAGKGGMEASSSPGYGGHILKAWQRLLHEEVQTHKQQRQENYLGCCTVCHRSDFIQFWWARNQGEEVEVR